MIEINYKHGLILGNACLISNIVRKEIHIEKIYTVELGYNDIGGTATFLTLYRW